MFMTANYTDKEPSCLNGDSEAPVGSIYLFLVISVKTSSENGKETFVVFN